MYHSLYLVPSQRRCHKSDLPRVSSSCHFKVHFIIKEQALLVAYDYLKEINQLAAVSIYNKLPHVHPLCECMFLIQ